MTTFEQFELADTLLQMAEDEGLTRASALQAAAVPILRRGGNMVAVAASGSGKTLAYGLPLLDRLSAEGAALAEGEGGGMRALILLPTPEGASRAAHGLAPYAAAAGLALTVPGDGWRMQPSEADIVVTTPGTALEGVQGSAIKLGALEALIVDGADLIAQLEGADVLESLFEHLPRDAQRVVFTTEAPQGELAGLIDRRVKRAMRFPPMPAVAGNAPAPEGTIAYVLASDSERVEVVTRLIAAGDGGAPSLFFRSAEAAAELADEITRRGFLVGAPGEDEDQVDVILHDEDPPGDAEAEAPPPAGRTISVHAPLDEDLLLARHGADDSATVVIGLRELPHLREIARRARRRVRPVPVAVESAALAGVEAFRKRLADAVREEDLGAQLLVIEPLLERYGAAEVAAAASALLRSGRPAATEAPGPSREAPGSAVKPGAAPTGRAAARPPSTWTRLFISLGEKDGIRAGDLVGAIAGEADVKGASVGKINIRESFSIVEVETPVAEKVIRSLNGTTVRGRSVRVDFDRGGSDRKPRGGPRGSGSRPGGDGVRRRVGPKPPREG